jgi:quercetin dioxygenase-like cupin family protein
MKVIRATEVPTKPADPDYFTGSVWQEPIHRTPTQPPMTSLHVHFAPGGRTNWHTHPLGQTLYVLSGVGLVQTRGEPAQTIRAGDTVWIPAGEEHWHGATPTRAMSHLAMQAAVDGTAATWLEPVDEDSYRAAGA